MTVAAFIGNVLISFAPILSIFSLYIYSTPQLVLICVAACFFYLLSLLTTSIVYLIFSSFISHVALKIVIASTVGVISSEFWRLCYYVMYRKAESGFKHKLLKTDFGLLPVAIASGIGYATSHTVITHGTFLMYSWGSATYYNPNTCPSIPFVTVNSITNCLLSFCNIAWMVLAFQGYSKKSWYRLVGLYFLHILTVLVTSMNAMFAGSAFTASCVLTIPLLLLLAGSSIAIVISELYFEYKLTKSRDGVVLTVGEVDEGPERAELSDSDSDLSERTTLTSKPNDAPEEQPQPEEQQQS